MRKLYKLICIVAAIAAISYPAEAWRRGAIGQPTTPSYFGIDISQALTTNNSIVNYGIRKIWEDGVPGTSTQAGDIVYDPGSTTWAALQPTEGVAPNWASFFNADIQRAVAGGKDILYTVLGEANVATAAPVTITSGTYNNGSGLVTLTMTSTVSFPASAFIVTSNLTGTGAFASLAGTFTSISGAGTTVTYNAGAGLGASTITGGRLNSQNTPMQPTWAYASGTIGQMNLTKLATWITTLCTQLHLLAPNSNIFIETRNEPDGSFLANGGTAAQAVLEQQTIYNAVAAFNLANGTTFKVLLAPMSNASTAAITFATTMLQAGACSYADIASHHSYSTSGVNIITLQTLLTTYNTLFAQYCAGKQIWTTEWGLSGTGVPDINDRAANTVKYVFVHRVYGRERSFEFAVDMYSNQFFPSYGLLLTDSPPSTSLSVVGTAYQAAYSWLVNRWIISGSSITSTLSTIPVAGPGGFQGLLAWAEDRSAWVLETPSWATRYYTIDGISHTPGATVTLGYSPIFFTSSWLLKRDLDPANDNDPMWLEKMA